MMITMPVFTPRRDLQWTQPPNVLTGIDPFGKSGFQMQQAVYETLHVQAVQHSDSAEPEEPGPPKQEVAKKQGNSY